MSSSRSRSDRPHVCTRRYHGTTKSQSTRGLVTILLSFTFSWMLLEHTAHSFSAPKSSVKTPPPLPTEIHTVEDLEYHFKDPKRLFRKKKKSSEDDDDIDYDSLIASLSVKGDTDNKNSHPVIELLHQRRRESSPLTPTDQTRPDGQKIALVVEGGGMRGCVTAGMVTALHYLGLEDTFDVIYGSSAGTVIGAYFNTRQLPFFGPEIYYDALTTSGKKFIDKKRLLRAIGIGLLDPRLLKDVTFRRSFGKPVLDLNYLLEETMQRNKPLDWNKFVEMQNVQPLKIVASGLSQQESIVLEMSNGGFNSIQELASGMRASCLIPGIAGPIVNVNVNSKTKKYTIQNADENNLVSDYEPLADALVFEPLPYRTAIKEGATHVVVLRSKPDGSDVTGKGSFFEKLIFRRFFKRKNKLRNIYKYMRKYGHKKIYAKQVLELNHATNSPENSKDVLGAHVMAVAVPPGSPDVARLELGRQAIFEGVRRGFARTYDCLVEDPKEKGRGMIVAQQCLPDEILQYDPSLVDSGEESAFEYFIKDKENNGEGLNLPDSLGKTALEANLPR